MKKIIYLVSFLVVSFYATAQTQVIRTTPANTVADSRLRALLNFYIPFGTNPSLNGGKDTVGGLFFKTLDSTLNVRVGNNINNSWLPLASRSYVDSRPIGVDSNYVKKVIRDSTIATDTSGIGDKFHPYYNLPGKNVIFVTPGRARAAENGIIADGATDQTAALNTLFATSVKEVIIDHGNVKITGVVDARGKKIILQNGAYFIGVAGTNADSLKNVSIEADYNQQIFDTSLTVTGIPHMVSAAWFGYKADLKGDLSNLSTCTDNTPILTRALASMPDRYKGTSFYYLNKPELYIPGGGDATTYAHLKSTFKINAECTVYGDGWTQTRLHWPNGVIGIWLQYPDVSGGTYKGGSNAILKDMALYGSNNGAVTDDSSYGIYVNSNYNTLDHIVVQNFLADGVHVEGHGPSSNANNNILNYVRSSANARHGIILTGPDANQCILNHCDADANGEIGIYENSFLGNAHYAHHTADNGIFYLGNQSFANIGTDRYICIRPNGPGTGVGVIKPGVTTNWAFYWYDAGTTSGYPTVWDSTKNYRMSMGYLFDNANQVGTGINLYVEGGQYPGRNAGNNTIYGGTFATALEAGAAIYSQSGILTVNAIQANSNGSNIKTYLNGENIDAIGFYDPTSGDLAFKYNPVYRAFSLTSNTGSNGETIFWSTRSTAGNQGRTAAIGNTIGFFNGSLHYNPDAGGYRVLGIRNTVPISGTYDVGDIYLYGGADTSHGYALMRCVVAGTPGTWTVVGGGGGSSALTQYNIGVGNAGGVLSGSSAFTYNAGLLTQDGTNLGSYYKLSGTPLWQWYYDASGANLISSQISNRIVWNMAYNGQITIDPDPATVSNSTISFLLKKGTLQTSFLKVGSSTQAASSVNYQNTANANGIVEYDGSSNLNFYNGSAGAALNFQIKDGGDLKTHYTGTGNRITGFHSDGTFYDTGVDPATVGGTIDATPTSGSSNAVQSGGVFTALGLKADVASPTFTGVITTPKVKGNGSAPTVAVGASITGTISVSGTDVAGEVTLVITSPSGLATNDELFTLTFNSAYGTAPFVVYSPSSATSSTTMATSYVKSVGTTNFVLGVANSGTYAATTYKWTYHVMQ